MEIVSHFEGRVRFRDQVLRRDQVLAQAQEAVQALPGVRAVEANPRSGSLLVHYDPGQIGLDPLVQAISGLAGLSVGATQSKPAEAQPRPRVRTAGRRATDTVFGGRPVRVLKNVGMLATMSVSMGALLFHLKKVHLLSGLAFLALSGDHVLERKRALLS
jgi:copper chaperone CopZ